MSTIKITKKDKNNLFFSKFKYSGTIRVNGADTITSSTNINDFIVRRKRRKRRIGNNNITDQEFRKLYDLPLIRKLIDYVNPLKNDKIVGTRAENNTLVVYTNSVEILEKLYNIDKRFSFVEAITPPAKILYFSNEPEYKHRVYMKSKQYTDEEYELIKDTLKQQERDNNISLSPGFEDHFLRKEYKWPFRKTSTHISSKYFINYNEPATLTYLHMLLPDCFGKIYKMEKRPENTVNYVTTKDRYAS